MRLLITLFILSTLGGCFTPSWVTQELNGRTGIIKYGDGIANGASSRQQSLQMAQEYCGGGYTITSERVYMEGTARWVYLSIACQ